MKKLAVLFLCIGLLVSCSVKTFNGISVVPQSLFGIGDVYCFGVKNSPKYNGWYTLTLDGPQSNTGVLDIDGKKHNVVVNKIEIDSQGNCLAITIDNTKFISK
jgi:hypothetical protein